MALTLILMPLVLVVLVAAVVVWVVRRGRAVVFDEVQYPGLAALCSSTVAARYFGLAASVVVFAAVAGLGRFGQGLFLAPSAAGAVLILAVMIGQQLAYGSARVPGVAGVEDRRVRDYVPRALSVVVLLVLGLLVAFAVWTTYVASPDESGLYREFSVSGTVRVATDAGPTRAHMSSTHGPFPGEYYTSALVLGLPIVLLIGSVTLWLTAKRPRNGSDPVLVRVDDALRRQTAEGIVAAAGLAFALSFVGVAASAAFAMGGMAEFGTLYPVGAGAIAVLALGSVGVAVWCAVLVLVPGGRTVKLS
jgi:hypothetical protein